MSEIERRAMTLKCLLVDPGHFIGPGEYWPDVLEEVHSRVLLVLCIVLLVHVLYNVVE